MTVTSLQLSCGINITFSPLTAMQVLILFWMFALKIVLQPLSPLIELFRSHGFWISAITVCIIAMLLVSIAEALLLLCKLIFVKRLSRSVISEQNLFDSLAHLSWFPFLRQPNCYLAEITVGLEIKDFKNNDPRWPFLNKGRKVILVSLLMLSLATPSPRLGDLHFVCQITLALL